MTYLDNANWIFGEFRKGNNCLKFRKTIKNISDAVITIAADSSYILWCNNVFIGQGGIRNYKDCYFCDEYTLTELQNNELNICILLQAYSESNFTYMCSTNGLNVKIKTDNGVFFTDSSWKYSAALCYKNNVPRINLPLPYEEQYDANLDDNWKNSAYDDSAWLAVTQNNYPQKTTELRDIPYLSETIIPVYRHIDSKVVTNNNYKLSFTIRDKIIDGKQNSSPFVASLLVSLQLLSYEDGDFDILYNNGVYELFCGDVSIKNNKIHLKQGINYLSFVYDGDLRFFYETSLAINVNAKTAGLKLIGAFDTGAINKKFGFGYYEKIAGKPITNSQKDEIYSLAKNGELAKIPSQYIIDLTENIFETDVFLETFCQQELEDFDFSDSKISSNFNNQLTILRPAFKEVRLLYDFGNEVNGYISLDLQAEKNAIIDFNFFEFIQPNGTRDLSENMHNTMRYIAKEGNQHYRSIVRRGFRYVYVTIKNCDKIGIANLCAISSNYPFTNRGEFFCSDYKLNKIFEVAKQTIKCCMTDTYIDCPAYEQVLWIGDMRNEALCDFFINGDSRLWLRCLKLAGRSLEFSSITLSQVPSGWYNIIPDWSFLWMRSCCEYYKYTGDKANSLLLLEFIKENVRGIKKHIDNNGLFYIEAWNMFDWADMDTPEDAVVTHQNCLCYLALTQCAELCAQLGDQISAQDFILVASNLQKSVTKYLWSDDNNGFTDCARYNQNSLLKSQVFSQQTQTVAYISDIFPQKNTILKNLMTTPPPNFIKAGSPFFEFFMLEALAKDGDDETFISRINSSWGFMLDFGATTFWEMWSGKLSNNKRPTRSYCHGWSAAPIFYFIEYIMGVQVLEAGYKKIKIAPHPCGLKSASATIPTPHGNILISFDSKDGKKVTNLNITIPPSIALQ